VYLGNRDTFTNNISCNDQISHTYWIHKKADADGKYIVECDGIRLNTIPDPIKDKYMAMGTIKVPYRKKTNTPVKLVKSFKDHFKKMKGIVDANADIIYNNQPLKDQGII